MSLEARLSQSKIVHSSLCGKLREEQDFLLSISRGMVFTMLRDHCSSMEKQPESENDPCNERALQKYCEQ
jgi:hypothetical protein